MLYRVLSSLGRVNVMTEKMNIVEDKVSVLKQDSAPGLNLKKVYADYSVTLRKILGKKLAYILFSSLRNIDK